MSASLTVAEQLLTGWLVSLQAAARCRGETPIEVVLTATNSNHVLDQVRAGDADLGFVEGHYTPRGLRSLVVAHDELVLVVRPGYRWVRRGSAITARELSHAPLVTRASGSGTRDYLTAALTNLLGPRTGKLRRRWSCLPLPLSGPPCSPVRPPPCSATLRCPMTSPWAACGWCRSAISACGAIFVRSGWADGRRPRERYRSARSHRIDHA